VGAGVANAGGGVGAATLPGVDAGLVSGRYSGPAWPQPPIASSAIIGMINRGARFGKWRMDGAAAGGRAVYRPPLSGSHCRSGVAH